MSRISFITDRKLYTLQVPSLLLTGNTEYYWRARFFDSDGQASSWSKESFFTIASIPGDMDGNGVADVRQVDDLHAEVVNSLPASEELKWRPEEIHVVSKDTISNKNIRLMDTAEFEIDESTPAHPPTTVLGYKLQMQNPGQRSLVTISLSEPAPTNMEYP